MKSDLSQAEIARIKKAENEIARGEYVDWKPGMFSKSSSPKAAKKKSTGTPHESAKLSSVLIVDFGPRGDIYK